MADKKGIGIKAAATAVAAGIAVGMAAGAVVRIAEHVNEQQEPPRQERTTPPDGL